jgi:hypothetical protein
MWYVRNFPPIMRLREFTGRGWPPNHYLRAAYYASACLSYTIAQAGLIASYLEGEKKKRHDIIPPSQNKPFN